VSAVFVFVVIRFAALREGLEGNHRRRPDLKVRCDNEMCVSVVMIIIILIVFFSG